MRTPIIGTDPVSQLLCGQDARRFHDGAFPMDPLRLDGVQPGAFTGQPAGENTDSAALLFDLVIVVAYPGPDLLTGVPRGIVPYQQ